MTKIRWSDWDRELKGPATYERFNAVAKLNKSYYHWILRLQLLVLLIISLLSSIPNQEIQSSKIIQYLTLTFIITFMALMILQYRSNHMVKWQKARFLAESTLSEAWFFLFGFDIYKGGLDKAKEAFIQRIKVMKTELRMPDVNVIFSKVDTNGQSNIIADDVLENDTPQWVQDNYNKSIFDKIVFYRDKRINDQLKYYKRRAEKNLFNSEVYFYMGLVLNIVGAVLAIMSIGGTVPSYTYIALFTTLSASFVSWTQTKQYEEISTKSSVAVEELLEIKNELSLFTANTDVGIVEKKVFEAEKLISREHKVKR